MTRTPPAISVAELDAAPELGVLAALLAVLDVADTALLAAHPELADHDRHYWIPTSRFVRQAASVIHHAAALRHVISEYRREVTRPDESEPKVTSKDNIPF